LNARSASRHTSSNARTRRRPPPNSAPYGSNGHFPHRTCSNITNQWPNPAPTLPPLNSGDSRAGTGNNGFMTGSDLPSRGFISWINSNCRVGIACYTAGSRFESLMAWVRGRTAQSAQPGRNFLPTAHSVPSRSRNLGKRAMVAAALTWALCFARQHRRTTHAASRPTTQRSCPDADHITCTRPCSNAC
jgi:hypothetical protein